MELIPNSKYFRCLRCNFSKKHFVVFGETSNFAFEKEAHPIPPKGSRRLSISEYVSGFLPPHPLKGEWLVMKVTFSIFTFHLIILR